MTMYIKKSGRILESHAYFIETDPMIDPLNFKNSYHFSRSPTWKSRWRDHDHFHEFFGELESSVRSWILIF